jgi:glycosyltransferase involved in cell wall biosynthesis
MEISLCMIIKDEQEVLDRCLSSFKDVVDEIIIVDTGSNDDSLKIASKYTNKIYQYKWNNDFASARNYSISKATKEYFMWVDADDYIKQSNKVG